MSILVQVLLTLLVLSACLADVVAHTLRARTLKETMNWLERLQQEVSCDKMNVINIFADQKGHTGHSFEDTVKAEIEQAALETSLGKKRDNNIEILCKAATIAQEVKSCHKYLEGIYYNLLSLVRHKEPCPVASGSTTSLKNFLKELDHVLQEEFKNQN